MKHFAVVFFLLLFCVVSFAQSPAPPAAAPSPTAPPAPTYSELSKLKILSAYKTALLAQTARDNAQMQMDLSIATFRNVVAQEDKVNGLPEGTQASVNIAKEEVNPIVPPPQTAGAAPAPPVKNESSTPEPQKK